MEITAYTAAELVALTQSERYGRLKHLPVSRIRALSHLHNPRLDPQTPIMYIAWVDGQVVGYRMVLCDELYTENGPQPVGWFSCIWVDAEQRGKGIAKQLVARCLQDWKGRIFSADSVHESKSLYRGTGLYKGDIFLEGVRAYLRASFADILVKKKPRLQPFKPLLSIGDTMLNWFVPGSPKSLPAIVETISEVEGEAEAFIQPYLQKLIFRRGKDDLNWITQYPWIRNGEPDEESRRYYFSSVAKRFKFVQWKLRNEDGKIVGYAMLSIRDGHLKTPYVFVEEAYVPVLAKAIATFMINERLETLTTFHPQLARHFKRHRKPFMFVKSVRREYFASTPLGQYIQTGTEPNICDGDGDQAFT